MDKFSKKIPKITPLGFLLALIAILFAFSLYSMIMAKSIGSELGTDTGSLVGKALGSLYGMTDGKEKGKKAGEEAGLSAEDSEAVISTQLHQIENLEVLAASVKLSNFHSIGQEDSLKYYAALYLVNGNVVFTVDMSQAEISAQSDDLHITLPKPAGSLYLDDSSVKKVSEYQTKLFNGDAESGFNAYLNTMKKIQEASEETLDNYETLLSAAKEAAKQQVTLLAKSASNDYDQIIVTFAD